jgi:hypothetical protein
MKTQSFYSLGKDIQNLLPIFEFTLEEARESLEIYNDKEIKIFKIDVEEVK